MTDQPKTPEAKVPMTYRTLALERSELIDEESRRMRIGVTSETPVERSFGIEVLDHSPGSIDTEWMGSGRAPLLLGHDPDRQIGVIENFQLDEANKRTVATVRFGESDLAQEIWRDCITGIRGSISCGYQIDRMERDDSGTTPVMRCAFTPLEASVVAIPADSNQLVGVARSEPKIIAIDSKEERNMAEEENKPVETPAPAVDVEAIKTEERNRTVEIVREQIQAQTAEILAMGRKFHKDDLAREHIAKGGSPEQFRSVILESFDPAQQPLGSVDLTPKEERSYSLMAAVRAAQTGDWRQAQFERECSDEIASKTKKEARGFYMPTNIGWMRDQTKSPTSAGGFLVGTDHLGDQFVEALYATALIPQLGARRLEGLFGDISIPRLSTSVSNTAFVAEGSAPSEGAEVFSQITLAPKTLAGYLDVSRKLMLQSDPSIERVIRDDIVQTFASQIDATAINGGASNEPTGIIANSDTPVVAIGTNGGPITYALCVDLWKRVADANGMGASPTFLTNPSVGAKLRTLPKQSSGVEGNFIMDPDGSILGYPVAMTTNVPSNLTKGSSSSNCSAMIFGDFSQVFMGFWSGIDVVVDTSSLSTAGGTRLAYFQDLDIAVRQPGAFAVLKDITTA